MPLKIVGRSVKFDVSVCLSFRFRSFKKGELVDGSDCSFFGVSEVLFCFVLLSRASTRSGSVELLLVCVLAPLGSSSVSFVGSGFCSGFC